MVNKICKPVPLYWRMDARPVSWQLANRLIKLTPQLWLHLRVLIALANPENWSG